MKSYIVETDDGEIRVSITYVKDEWVAKVYNEDDELIAQTLFSEKPTLDDVNDALYLW